MKLFQVPLPPSTVPFDVVLAPSQKFAARPLVVIRLICPAAAVCTIAVFGGTPASAPSVKSLAVPVSVPV